MAASSEFPRTLTQMLRDWDDAALVDLLLARPDLAFPQLRDLTQVASRATTRHSVSAALDSLNAFELEVARRASALPLGCAPRDLPDSELDESAVVTALQRLQQLALVWGDSAMLRPVRALSALLAETKPPAPLPPPHPPLFPDTPRQPPALVDKVAAGSAFEFVRRVEVLVEHCDHQPLRMRQTGGFASREVRAVAALLDVPLGVATGHLEIAQAAGLLGLAAVGTDEVLLPTIEFDSWQQLELADQWSYLATSWLETPAPGEAWLKRLFLQAFGSPVDGRVLSTADLRTWVAWHRPRLAAADRHVVPLLDQASWVGVTGLGALSSFAPPRDTATLQPYLPPRTEHILVQADLTAIAPGPLTADASRELSSLAEVESRGGATVYRFTTESLHRAIRLGWDVSDILAVLEARSRTELPQPLRYLVQDLARRRTDGVTPSAETAERVSPQTRVPVTAVRPAVGRQSPHSDQPQRGAPRALGAEPPATDRLRPEDAAAIVAELKRGESASSPRRDGGAQPPAPLVATAVDVLREAVETGEVVWLSVVDALGGSSERLVRALEVSDGQLRALDARAGEGVTVPVRRITAAHILRGGR